MFSLHVKTAQAKNIQHLLKATCLPLTKNLTSVLLFFFIEKKSGQTGLEINQCFK